MSKDKRQNQIIGYALLGALLATTVLLSVVDGELVSPVGLKGEGLLIVLFFYFVFRFALRRIFAAHRSG